MPVGVDVLIPYGNGRFEGDDWCAADVVRPMFNFAATDSTRASANVAGLTMGSAMMNYHARDAACVECGQAFGPEKAQSLEYECPDCEDSDLQIVVERTDVGNVVACRETLLATTHGLTEKKFAVLDAIIERGGQADASGNKVHATKDDIIAGIQENDDIATLTKPQINNILEELDEKLIINIKDNPEDRRENLYEYDGSSVFKTPNVFDGTFDSVECPITGQPIPAIAERQLESLNATMEVSSLAEAGSTDGGGLDSFGVASDADLTDVERAVAERVAEVLDGTTIPSDVVADNSLRATHMVGDTPVDRDGDFVRPAREPSGSDRVDGFMSPDNDVFDADDFDGVDEAVSEALASLRSKGVLDMQSGDDGVDVTVSL
jgi:DNA-binding MarR family transcriptional regulator/DNA-directed RNA polymerase subunit RPC12/RpoP